ncbi:MAG: DUF4215 domain-containing protein [Deltaproteobacteria bacterium]|nr:DUF4215 domain-containing protein [Deltaproteobacteria bacterium]
MKLGKIFLVALFTLAAWGSATHATAEDAETAAKPIFPVETYCGDGAVNAEDETCDDGNNVDGDGCDAECRTEMKPIFPVEPECGNGIPSKGEACDDGNTLDGDGCDRFCQIESKPSAPEAPPATTLPENQVAPSNPNVSEPEFAEGTAAGESNFVQAMQGPDGTGGWSCSMVVQTNLSTPYFSCAALILFSTGLLSLFRKGR